MIKGSTQEENIIMINIYTHSTGAPQYIRKMLSLELSDSYVTLNLAYSKVELFS